VRALVGEWKGMCDFQQTLSYTQAQYRPSDHVGERLMAVFDNFQ
jgi:hypothetical protein